MGLRTPSDRIPYGEMAFMNACIKKALTEGDTSIKVRNFGTKKKEGS